MTEPQAHPVLDEIRTALAAVRTAIAEQPSTEEAFWLAQTAAILIREGADELARERALIAVQLTDNAGVTLTQLGHMIGVSKPRAGQIVDHGRRVLAGESPHVPG